MKEILNLLPLEAGAAGPGKGIVYYLLMAVPVYAALMTFLLASKVMETRKIDIEIKKLGMQKTDLSTKLKPQVPVALSPAIDKEISSAVEKTPRWSRIVSELSLIIHEEIWLSSIESKEEKGVKKMSIKGFSSTQLGVANLISSLEASDFFYEVEIVFSQKGEKDISFELRTRLKWT